MNKENKLSGNACKNCKGTGAVPFEDVEIKSCPVCKGSGKSGLVREEVLKSAPKVPSEEKEE